MLQPLIEVRRYRGDVVTHSHDFHQVVLPLEGRLTMTVGGVDGHVAADSVALVAASVSHSFTGSKGNAFLVLDIPPRAWVATDALGVLLWARARQQPFVPVDGDVLRLIEYLAQSAERGRLPEPLVDHACALLLGTVAIGLGLGEQGAWPRGLRRVVGYVDTHLEWPLAVADMARAGNVSASRLHALFRKHLATTPQRYLTQRRLHRAAELLAHTSLPVIEVAMRVGYGDQAAFTRSFRRHVGRAPLSYRAAAARQAGHKSQ